MGVPENKLPDGVSMELVYDAITESGYPLQLEIADIIGTTCSVQHEWAYEDADTAATRSLDILASRKFYDLRKDPRVYPAAQVLIECKRSLLPHVFFVPNGRPPAAELPMVCGVHDQRIVVHLEKENRANAIGLNRLIIPEHDAFLSTPPSCFTFSKAKRKGKNLELCGSEAFQGLIQPLTKAMIHYQKARKPRKTFLYFSIDLAFSIGVIDGPMLKFQGGQLSYSPWIRVFRHEHVPVEDGPSYGRQIAVDVVHKEFLGEYIESYLAPFCARIAETTLAHEIEIAEREAVAADFSQAWAGKIRPVEAVRNAQKIRVDALDPHVKGAVD